MIGRSTDQEIDMTMTDSPIETIRGSFQAITAHDGFTPDGYADVIVVGHAKATCPFAGVALEWLAGILPTDYYLDCRYCIGGQEWTAEDARAYSADSAVYAVERLNQEQADREGVPSGDVTPSTPEERVARIVAFAEGLGRKAEIADIDRRTIRDAVTWVRLYTGRFEFLVDLRGKGVKSAGQAKGVVNCIRADLARGGDGMPAQKVQETASEAPQARWAKHQGEWMVAVPPAADGALPVPGDTVTVHKANGETADAVLGAVFGIVDGRALYANCRKVAAPVEGGGIDLTGLPLGIKSGTDTEVGRFAYQPPDGEQAQFLVIERPVNGRWAGTIFVKRQHSDEMERAGRQEPGGTYGGGNAAPALLAILAEPQAAMELYGRLIGSCGHCGRTLTNEVSRERGIGPKCATKMGW